MDYQNRFTTTANQTEIVEALTSCIRNWWTEDFTGSANHLEDTFTVRFGNTFKTFIITGLSTTTIIWTCVDSFIDMPELNKKDEWKGTRICWTITPDKLQNSIEIIHKGLTPEIECFEICQQGWVSFLASLRNWLETNEGQPYKPSGKSIIEKA